MKILLRADGSFKKGMGDVVVAQFIVNKFSDDQSIFVTVSSEPGYTFLSGQMKKVMGIPAVSPMEEAVLIEKIFNDIKPSIVVLLTPCDYPESYYIYFCRTAKARNAVLVGRYVPNIQMEKYLDIVFDYGEPPNDRMKKDPFYFGPQFLALDPTMEQIKTRKDTFHSELNVLITFGGSDETHATKKIINAFVKKNNTTYSFHIVLGEASEDVFVNGYYPDNFHFYRSLSHREFLELMNNCDLAVSAGGITAFELAYFGIPSLLYAVDEHQPRNIDSIVRAGSAIAMGNIKLFDAQKLLHEIDLLASDATRRLQMSKKGKSLVDGKGAERLRQVILDCLKEKAL